MSLADIKLIAATNRGRVQVQVRQLMVELTVDETRQLMAALHTIAKSVAWQAQDSTTRRESSPARDPLSRAHLQKRMLTLLEKAAELGAYCPTNREIAEELGTDRQSVPKLWEALETRRLIRVERMTNARIVTIVASGKTTGHPDWLQRRKARAASGRYRNEEREAAP